MENEAPRTAVSKGTGRLNGANPAHRQAARILKGTATFEDRFIPDHENLKEVISHLRSMGSKIVFTTGVWDLFHIGHAEYIQRGREEAQKLYPEADHFIVVVGVDTDALTKERKGPTRPIVPEDERCRVLGALRHVDIITPQYEANQLFRLVEHDVRVISTSTKDLPKDDEEIREQCEHLVNLPPQAETSTSARIRTLAMDGRHEVLEKIEALIVGMRNEAQD